MSHIKVSSPFLRKFIHADVAVSDDYITILDYPTIPEKRIVVILQNKGANTANIVLNTDGTQGLNLLAQSSISIDNYNGVVRAYSDAGTVIHVAYSVV
jgi:hypothetical protein